MRHADCNDHSTEKRNISFKKRVRYLMVDKKRWLYSDRLQKMQKNRQDNLVPTAWWFYNNNNNIIIIIN